MVGIIGAMEKEVQSLEALMAGAESTEIGPFRYVRGMLGGKETVLLQCGIGKVNAAIGCALMLERFAPSWVVNTGSAGGLDPSLTFGDLVVSASALYHDVDVTAFGYRKGQVPGSPERFGADASLIRLAELSAAALRARGELPEGVHVVRGCIGSGDVFVHDGTLIERIRLDFPELTAVEMEGAAIAHACSLFRTPFVIIRSLSDIAGKESPMKFEEFLPLASSRSSALVLEMLKGAE
ncbi:MAG: 5'-methylthioadenosine/S-adenosylhomocysteine nucleosidase [Treponema sp. GWB1_62_6]|nr:MAG: 5'-methylthioadenosine/S-adenosylhomocysteine nucleosidase [Treponema sp. GWA1_62_8]OHE62163.1 MAG: 5'-methylthioadenosine/S-adenosylhomocysteine nucleosidase [Treponema sp. GWB1_62_6]OHE70282.1 MAG: 5'-methylthioadenosine/S-adenosylhomocysteine nucleosidase [Treponema sp. GWC1_61_84]HCM26847.1 5'-methylthioadenosine/S-adenosylhomocysteine nucleosidase [Treponema sp.]